MQRTLGSCKTMSQPDKTIAYCFVPSTLSGVCSFLTFLKLTSGGGGFGRAKMPTRSISSATVLARLALDLVELPNLCCWTRTWQLTSEDDPRNRWLLVLGAWWTNYWAWVNLMANYCADPEFEAVGQRVNFSESISSPRNSARNSCSLPSLP
jgi:hypothetical protein